MTPRAAAAIDRLLRYIPIAFLERLADRLEGGEELKSSDAIKCVFQRSRGRVVDIRLGHGEERIPLTDTPEGGHTSG